MKGNTGKFSLVPPPCGNVSTCSNSDVNLDVRGLGLMDKRAVEDAHVVLGNLCLRCNIAGA